MLEVVFIVLLFFVVVLAFFYFSFLREKNFVDSARLSIVSARERLRIAERKFMQGKIKRSVFDSIVDDLEEELYSSELILFRFNKPFDVSLSDKVSLVMQKMDSVSKRKRKRVESILRETELIRHELDLLEAKLLKHEIKQSVFERLVKKKEFELIKKERELTNLVLRSRAVSPVQEPLNPVSSKESGASFGK
jgi:hypothetical protein